MSVGSVSGSGSGGGAESHVHPVEVLRSESVGDGDGTLLRGARSRGGARDVAGEGSSLAVVDIEQLGGSGGRDGGHAAAGDTAGRGGDGSRAGHQVGGGIALGAHRASLQVVALEARQQKVGRVAGVGGGGAGQENVSVSAHCGMLILGNECISIEVGWT